MSKAARRHHNARIRRKRAQYWGAEIFSPDLTLDSRQLGICASTPKPHSCPGCSNLRKSEGKSIHERKQEPI